LGATRDHERCVGGLEKKFKEKQASRNLEDDSVGTYVVLGRRGIGQFLRARLDLIKILGFILGELCVGGVKLSIMIQKCIFWILLVRLS